MRGGVLNRNSKAAVAPRLEFNYFLSCRLPAHILAAGTSTPGSQQDRKLNVYDPRSVLIDEKMAPSRGDVRRDGNEMARREASQVADGTRSGCGAKERRDGRPDAPVAGRRSAAWKGNGPSRRGRVY
jgi:hypothetical protein